MPLHHLTIDLDGPTISDSKFSGPTGKLLHFVADLELNPNFTQISIGPSLIKMPEEVIQDLSTDQHYGYKIVGAIRDGVFPSNLALLKIGPVYHSRWLATVNRLLRLWVSKHGLKGEILKSLQLIWKFIIGL